MQFTDKQLRMLAGLERVISRMSTQKNRVFLLDAENVTSTINSLRVMGTVDLTIDERRLVLTDDGKTALARVKQLGL